MSFDTGDKQFQDGVKLSLIQGKFDELEPDEFGPPKHLRMKSTDGKIYKVIAAPEVSDLSTLNGQNAVLLGLIEKDLDESLVFTTVGYRILPKKDKTFDSVV